MEGVPAVERLIERGRIKDTDMSVAKKKNMKEWKRQADGVKEDVWPDRESTLKLQNRFVESYRVLNFTSQ